MESPLGKQFLAKNREMQSFDVEKDSTISSRGGVSGSSSRRLMSCTSPLHGLEKGVEGTLKQELLELYALLRCDPIYTSLAYMQEAVLIMSAQEPHMILHCSSSLEALLGSSAHEIFGTSLASLTAVVSSESMDQRSVVPLFLRNMRDQSRSHTLLHLVHRNQGVADAYQECSLTSFPIYQGKTQISRSSATSELELQSNPENDEEFLRTSDHNSIHSCNNSSYSSGRDSSLANDQSAASIRLSSLCRQDETSPAYRVETINYYGILVTPLMSRSTVMNL